MSLNYCTSWISAKWCCSSFLLRQIKTALNRIQISGQTLALSMYSILMCLACTFCPPYFVSSGMRTMAGVDHKCATSKQGADPWSVTIGGYYSFGRWRGFEWTFHSTTSRRCYYCFAYWLEPIVFWSFNLTRQATTRVISWHILIAASFSLLCRSWCRLYLDVRWNQVCCS